MYQAEKAVAVHCTDMPCSLPPTGVLGSLQGVLGHSE